MTKVGFEHEVGERRVGIDQRLFLPIRIEIALGAWWCAVEVSRRVDRQHPGGVERAASGVNQSGST